MTPWILEATDPDAWAEYIDARSVRVASGCIEWQMSAARAAWLARRGPLALGFVPDHLCRNKKKPQPQLRELRLRFRPAAPGIAAVRLSGGRTPPDPRALWAAIRRGLARGRSRAWAVLGR